MGITDGQVIDELLRSGRLVDKRGRFLKDWRAKGLLPPLAGGSNGRARGRAYRWDEGDIIERAKVVYDRLAGNRDAKAALISIGLMGFEVCPTQLQAAWLESLIKDKSKYEKLVERHGDGDASLARAAAIAEGGAKQLGVSRSLAVQLAAEFSALIFQEDPDATSAGEVVRDLARQFADRWIGQSILTDAINHERTEFILGWFSRIGTNGALTEMFSQSSDAEIQHAHDQWLTIWRAVTRLLPKVAEPSVRVSRMRRLTCMVGRLVVPSLLWGNTRGYKFQIADTVNLSSSGWLMRCSSAPSRVA